MGHCNHGDIIFHATHNKIVKLEYLSSVGALFIIFANRLGHLSGVLVPFLSYLQTGWGTYQAYWCPFYHIRKQVGAPIGRIGALFIIFAIRLGHLSTPFILG